MALLHVLRPSTVLVAARFDSRATHRSNSVYNKILNNRKIATASTFRYPGTARKWLFRSAGRVRSVQAAQQQEPSSEIQSRVMEVLDRAQELEYTNKLKEAVDLMKQGLTHISEAGGWEMGEYMLRQRISHVLFTEADYQGAVEEGRRVYDGVCRGAGEGSGEAVLFGLRLGILEAANGNLQAGTELIFRAGTMVAPNLQRMVTQTQELGQKGGQEEALAELESACQRLAVCLGESNYYGAIFTIKKMLEEGKDEMVVTGWGNLNQGIIHGFTNLVLALPPTTHSIKNALREHSRLVEALSSRPLLAERAQQQDAQLQDLVAKAGELRQEQ